MAQQVTGKHIQAYVAPTPLEQVSSRSSARLGGGCCGAGAGRSGLCIVTCIEATPNAMGGDYGPRCCCEGKACGGSAGGAAACTLPPACQPGPAVAECAVRSSVRGGCPICQGWLERAKRRQARVCDIERRYMKRFARLPHCHSPHCHSPEMLCALRNAGGVQWLPPSSATRQHRPTIGPVEGCAASPVRSCTARSWSI